MYIRSTAVAQPRSIRFANQDQSNATIDLNQLLIPNPAATFFMRLETDGPAGIGLKQGALLVVDRSVRPKNGSIAVIAYEGEFLCCQIWQKSEKKATFIDANGREIDGGEVTVFGTVRAAVTAL